MPLSTLICSQAAALKHLYPCSPSALAIRAQSRVNHLASVYAPGRWSWLGRAWEAQAWPPKPSLGSSRWLPLVSSSSQSQQPLQWVQKKTALSHVLFVSPSRLKGVSILNQFTRTTLLQREPVLKTRTVSLRDLKVRAESV